MGIDSEIVIHVSKIKNHGLIDPRCTGICPLKGYCGKCIRAPKMCALEIPKEEVKRRIWRKRNMSVAQQPVQNALEHAS